MRKQLKIITALTSVLLLSLPAVAANDPESGPANNNSHRTDTIIFDQTPEEVDEVVGQQRRSVDSVRIGGNGNSARLHVTIDGTEHTTDVRPINNTINTIKADGIEVDVFVRGNKIDGILGVWDLNCYGESLDCDVCACTVRCQPTRDNPCDCACACDYIHCYVEPCESQECSCYGEWLTANVCPPCRNGVGNNHVNCHSKHQNEDKRAEWEHCQCCGPNAGSNPFVPDECCHTD